MSKELRAIPTGNTSDVTPDNAQDIVRYRVWLSGLPPKISNRRSNSWKAYHYPRRAWIKGAAAQMAATLGDLPPAHRISVKITAYVPREADQDNADGYRKCAHDLLQYMGLIVEDSPAHLVSHPVEQKVVGSAPRRPKDPNKWPDYGQRMMRHVKKLGLMLEIEVLAV